MSLKQSIGGALPYPVIENGRKIFHFGFHRCKVCENRVRRFLDYGYGFEVLERLQVVGGLRRYADICPVCHSSARERLIWFWLTHRADAEPWAPGTRIAHFAPEKGLSQRLKALAPRRYVAYDIDPTRYRHLDEVRHADLSQLALEDSSVDVIICNHVLEHVPDVAQSLREIHRVMAPGGTAILQVPIALKLENPIELGAKSTGAERIEKLGQEDHLRLFTPESYKHALEHAGFKLERYQAFERDGDAAITWRLDPFETLHICRKPE